MRYKVLIRKCSDQRYAGSVAFGIARRAGVPPEKAFSIISEKTVCIKKKAEREEAILLKNEFEALGAAVDLVELDEPAKAEKRGAAPTRTPSDEEEETPGRIVSEMEYTARMSERNDIFYIENNRPLNRIEIICLVAAIAAGMFMSTRKIALIPPDFIEANAPARVVVISKGLVDRPDQAPPEKAVQPQVTQRRVLKPKTSSGSGGHKAGGGSPYERVTKTGLLGIISGQIKGKTVANADLFSKGGFTDGIDAMLLGMGGLKAGGGGGVGRRGAVGMGFGVGYGSGIGGETGLGGIDDLIGSLSNTGFSEGLQLKRRTATLRVAPPTIAGGSALTGGRSKLSIARVVQQNLAALRHAYNRRLREKPGLKGRITVKFAIDEFGKVLFCSIEESTMGDRQLESLVTGKIRRWQFEKIDKVGDVTEVIYPFVFSQ